MVSIKKIRFKMFLISIFLIFSINTFAENQSSEDINQDNKKQIKLEDELAWLSAEMSEKYVSIATKNPQEVAKAPSIVTIITAEEIENMGARKLTDVLRIIPGFDVYKSAVFGMVRFGTRGLIVSTEKVKVLVDGHALNWLSSGSPSMFFDDLELKNVKKIEVIREPGSALYGANEFLAVINIITKDVDDIDGIKVSTGMGSFDTQDYNILYGRKLFGIDVVGYANFFNTNGYNGTLDDDPLTLQTFFNRFSQAPGRLMIVKTK